MSRKCAAALFVGVASYNDELLFRSAAEGDTAGDAIRMAEHFRVSSPSTVRDLVTREHGTAPTRTAMLKGLRRLARRVPADAFGVVYFAGHAVETSRGLVLMGEDFESIIPFDSGVPLTRAFDLLNDAALPGASFLCILDCCRRKIDLGHVDPIPDHISIMYACPSGGEAHADIGGGFFTRQLLQVLRRGQIERPVTLTCHKLVALLRQNSSSSDPADQIHAAGRSMDDLILPTLDSLDGNETPHPNIFITLETRLFDSQREMHEALTQTRRLVARTLGFSDEKSITSILLIDRNYRKFRVAMPSNSFFVSEDALLEAVLDRSNDYLYVLDLTWPFPINDLAFESLRPLLPNAKWIKIPKPLLNWSPTQQSSYSALLTVMTNNERTSAKLFCIGDDGTPAPLRFIGQSLSHVMKHLRSISSKEVSDG